jgi:hypothetical protein
MSDAISYNEAQLRAGKLTTRHVTAMTEQWQRSHALEPIDGKAGPDTIASIEVYLEAKANPPAAPIQGMYDRRKHAAQAHGEGGQWKVTDRPIAKVTGICLHQTACNLGERVERYDTVGAHLCVTRAGKIIWLHDFDRLVMHGNGWNTATIGVEIDGLYAGVEGDPSTVWDDPSTSGREQGQALTPQTIEAMKSIVRWIKGELPQVNALVAHRQSSSSRRNDPGSAIWKAIALPMHAELGLSDGGVGFKLGNGIPIPEAWDPRCKNVPY